MFLPLYDNNAIKHVTFPFVNHALIAITVAVYVVFQSGVVLEADMAVAFGFGVIPAVVTELRELPPELHYIPAELSLVTYAFIHGGWLHLLGNMLFVWVFGDNIEDAVGHPGYLIFYLAVAAIAGYGEALASPSTQLPIVGASGAAAGIIGAYLMLHPDVRIWILALGKIPIRLPASWCLIAWFVFQIVLFMTDESKEVAWVAHIVGFVVGAFLIVFMRRRGVPLFDRA